MGRYLGLDYGDKRVGVALSDPTHFLASPHLMIERVSDEDVVRQLVPLCKERDVEKIILGLPLNMNGTRGPAVEKAMQFREKLMMALPGMPVETWDERLSTVSAQRTLIDAGTSRTKRKGLVDKIAAQILLQHYLDAQAPFDS